jgi:hypothetical protein
VAEPHSCETREVHDSDMRHDRIVDKYTMLSSDTQSNVSTLSMFNQDNMVLTLNDAMLVSNAQGRPRESGNN